METFIKERNKVRLKSFPDIADKLLNRTHLKCNGKIYRICEIEFYYLNNDHKDEYTHANANQLRYARWYFHRYGSKSYKEGTYKGMDLTLGNKKNNSYCGILIRSIYDIENDVMIEGPCRTVNKLIGSYGFEKVKEFMEDKNDPLSCTNTKNNKSIYIRDSDMFKNDIEEIYTGARIGLSDKYPEWLDAKYRFLIKPKLIRKGKKSLVPMDKSVYR